MSYEPIVSEDPRPRWWRPRRRVVWTLWRVTSWEWTTATRREIVADGYAPSVTVAERRMARAAVEDAVAPIRADR